jgi:hypothetical protein
MNISSLNCRRAETACILQAVKEHRLKKKIYIYIYFFFLKPLLVEHEGYIKIMATEKYAIYHEIILRGVPGRKHEANVQNVITLSTSKLQLLCWAI